MFKIDTTIVNFYFNIVFYSPMANPVHIAIATVIEYPINPDHISNCNNLKDVFLKFKIGEVKII